MYKDFKEIKNGVVLSELGGYGDGPYCAKYGRGAALVMLGSYIVDASESIPYSPNFVFKPGRPNYGAYLRENIAEARFSGALVGVSVVSVKISDTIDFLQSAEEAGADYVSLCVHSTLEIFIRAKASAALCCRENWDNLKKWAKAILEAVQIPVIFKIGAYDTPDAADALEVISEIGIPIMHVDFGDISEGSKGLTMLRQFKSKPPFLIASGGINDLEGALRVLNSGGDAVAIGTAAMKNPKLCGNLQRLLRNERF